MKLIKFKDNITKEYSINKLKEIPFFKKLIEGDNKIDDIIQINDFNSDIMDHLIHNYKNINFDKYDFDDLFQAKQFLELDDLWDSEIQTYIVRNLFSYRLADLLIKTNKINLERLKQYLVCEHRYFLSTIIEKYPKLTYLYPYIEYLKYHNELDLTKFTNLIELKIVDSEIKTFSSYDNLKNLKELCCTNCINLEDGCFNIFENLTHLYCNGCKKLTKPFDNLKNLWLLHCRGCNLEDGCFDNLTSLTILNCEFNYKLKKPFNKNLKSLKELSCAHNDNLQDGCFDELVNLVKLHCGKVYNSDLKEDIHFVNKEFKNPFNNLKNLEILKCDGCDNLEDGCFDSLMNLEYLSCKHCRKLKTFPDLLNLRALICNGCSNLEDGCFDVFTNLNSLHCAGVEKLKSFNINLKGLTRLNCDYCNNLEDGCFDMFTKLDVLSCACCKKLKSPFNKNLKDIRQLDCSACSNLEDGCFDVFTNLSSLWCSYCKKLKRPFNENLKIYLVELHCPECSNLEEDCLDILENLRHFDCAGCKKLKKAFNNLKTLNNSRCPECPYLEDNCFYFGNKRPTILNEQYCTNCKRENGPFRYNFLKKTICCSCCCTVFDAGCTEILDNLFKPYY